MAIPTRQQEKRGKGERVEGKGSARENPTGRGGSPRFCRILFFPLSQEGVPSHRRDMECPIDEAPIAQALYKLSAYPLAGASRRGKHGTPPPAGAFPLTKAARCPPRALPRAASATKQHAAPRTALTPRKGSSPRRATANIPSPNTTLSPFCFCKKWSTFAPLFCSLLTK